MHQKFYNYNGLFKKQNNFLAMDHGMDKNLTLDHSGNYLDGGQSEGTQMELHLTPSPSMGRGLQWPITSPGTACNTSVQPSTKPMERVLGVSRRNEFLRDTYDP